MHRACEELTDRAVRQIGGHRLIHSLVGTIKPGDMDYMSCVRCDRAILRYYSEGLADLSLLLTPSAWPGPGKPCGTGSFARITGLRPGRGP